MDAYIGTHVQYVLHCVAIHTSNFGIYLYIMYFKPGGALLIPSC